jgi:hypothetical protein
MDQIEQRAAFERELNVLIGRYADEFELSVLDAVGVLEAAKFKIMAARWDSDKGDRSSFDS